MTVSLVRMTRKIYLKALGCRLNEAELEQWSRTFQAHGFQLASRPEMADMVVINTCAVTGEAVRKSRQLIRRSQRHNPLAKLVVSGCYPSLACDGKLDIEGIDLVIHNRDKDQLAELVMRELAEDNMPLRATRPGSAALFERGRSRAFVKVQDGCRYRCTFCIVTVARGDERSRAIAAIVDEINALTDQGIKEAVLTGVHVGGYGSDIGNSLQELIGTILHDTDLPRLRLASLEPWDLPESFFELFANPRLMPHLHLPLQSGCDSVLRRMARRCKTGEYESLVSKVRAEVPDFSLTTDIIVGFPGESEDEWRQGMNFIERIGFSHIHIFTYSQRPGTKAARMPHPVPAPIKRQRGRQLHAVAAQMKTAALRNYLGRTFPILWEGSRKPPDSDRRQYSGYTPNFLRVKVLVPDRLRLDNTLRSARLESLSNDGSSAIAKLL
jgi:threonylcarbamoyladenosine tRNA methylthiotransferase MtaB